ncbi:YuzD family protein [Salisediminibacterium beveridgei]|uniref:YuzD-like protein n=1 Tax=Salisediminibacterium beveridgei TaxID=632773 RepID=A0A1D7QSS4_9BACI|nr:YuzD family protein [Salisediminibacterium beveridgei]AOM82031.1 YuzD-like protein [Salisediminibacterium beveridgei]
MSEKITITVYGAEEKCASCIHLPSAKETMEWLQAALYRKFPDLTLTFRYVDIEAAESPEDEKWSQAILNDDYFYPLVILNGEVAAEGDPHLPELVKQIEQLNGSGV